MELNDLLIMKIMLPVEECCSSLISGQSFVDRYSFHQQNLIPSLSRLNTYFLLMFCKLRKHSNVISNNIYCHHKMNQAKVIFLPLIMFFFPILSSYKRFKHNIDCGISDHTIPMELFIVSIRNYLNSHLF